MTLRNDDGTNRLGTKRVCLLQAQQAEETSTTIQKLRSKVEAGEGSSLELERAEGMLSNLTGSLNYLQTEMKVALKGARRAFRQGFGEESESEVCSPSYHTVCTILFPTKRTCSAQAHVSDVSTALIRSLSN